MRRWFCMLLILGGLNAAAQSVTLDPSPGKVSIQELELATYPLDTTANAVYLVNRFDVSVLTTDALELNLERKVYHRMKILKDAGKSVADYKISYLQGDYLEKIDVTTYNLVDGKIVKTKLDKKFIFRENFSGDNYTCTFSAPDVRVGSVVEISFILQDKRYWEIPDLVLQHSIPSNLSVASFNTPDFLVYNRFVRGYINPEYSKTSFTRTLRNMVKNSCEMVTETFTLKDAPALPKESHSIYPVQYRTAVNYELSALVIPGYLSKTYSLKWEDVDRQVKDSPIFSQCRQTGSFLTRFQSSDPDEVSAITKVREAVVSAVKWNGEGHLVPANIRTVIKNGTGSSADINAIVASVLNSMGYKASPMLLRRRSRGRLLSHYVRTDAFTDLILHVETPSGAVHVVDAGPDFGAPDIINPDYLVNEARVIPLDSSVKPFWADLTSLAFSSNVIGVKAELTGESLVTGRIDVVASKEASYLVRATRGGFGSDDKYFEHVEEGEAYETVSYKFASEPFTPVTKFSIDFEQEPVCSGDLVYIKPFLITEHHNSDFPPGERHTPIDFPVLENITYIYSLKIPEGYQVEQLPSNVSIRADGFNMNSFCRYVADSSDTVTMRFSFRNQALVLSVDQYNDLRAFWEQLCNMYNGIIVLRKL